MDRRRILLVVAVLVAAVGSALVFLYTKGADTRAEERFDTVEVLEATAVISPGETFEDAQSAGKLALQAVSKDALLDGYQTTTDSLTGTVSLGTIYPGEQIIQAKWGQSATVESALQIPDENMAASVNLTDPARVAGFVNPGSEVAVFWTGINGTTGANMTKILLTRVTVLGVGSTTPVSTTTTDETGVATTEQLPRTLLTLSLTQAQTQKVLLGASTGELAFGLLTEQSASADAPETTPESLFK
jgi:pilus assembly protein CpaB